MPGKNKENPFESMKKFVVPLAVNVARTAENPAGFLTDPVNKDDQIRQTKEQGIGENGAASSSTQSDDTTSTDDTKAPPQKDYKKMLADLKSGKSASSEQSNLGDLTKKYASEPSIAPQVEPVDNDEKTSP